MPRPLTISTAAFDGHDLSVALEEIAALGVPLVELAYIQGYVAFDETAFEERNAAAVQRRLSDAGLSSVAMSAHVNAGLPEAVDQLKRRMDFARRIGAGIVITNAAPQALRTGFLRNMEALIPHTERAGAVIALENPGHGSGNLIGGAADAAAVVQAVGSPQVRVNFDLGNVFTYSHERTRPEEDLEAVLPWAVHFHLKDVRSTPEGWEFTAIGDGSIDYAAVFRRLTAHNVSVPIGLELPLRLRRPGRSDPVRVAEPLPLDLIRAALRRSLEHVRGLEAGGAG